jgi:hypothetical protein
MVSLKYQEWLADTLVHSCCLRQDRDKYKSGNKKERSKVPRAPDEYFRHMATTKSE